VCCCSGRRAEPRAGQRNASFPNTELHAACAPRSATACSQEGAHTSRPQLGASGRAAHTAQPLAHHYCRKVQLAQPAWRVFTASKGSRPAADACQYASSMTPTLQPQGSKGHNFESAPQVHPSVPLLPCILVARSCKHDHTLGPPVPRRALLCLEVGSHQVDGGSPFQATPFPPPTTKHKKAYQPCIAWLCIPNAPDGALTQAHQLSPADQTLCHKRRHSTHT